MSPFRILGVSGVLFVLLAVYWIGFVSDFGLYRHQTCQLLKATCSPNPNPRISRPGLASHLVLPHEPIHSLYLLHLIFFYNIIKIIIFFRVYTYIQITQWIHTVKKSTQHSITTYMIKFTNMHLVKSHFLVHSRFKK